MTDKQKLLVDQLNEMYCTQSRDYRYEHREEYFSLLEYITRARSEDMTYDELRQKIKDVEWDADRKLAAMAGDHEAKLI